MLDAFRAVRVDATFGIRVAARSTVPTATVLEVAQRTCRIGVAVSVHLAESTARKANRASTLDTTGTYAVMAFVVVGAWVATISVGRGAK